MIDKLHGKYYARCDTCNTTVGAFDSFAEAVTYAKANHWRLVRTSGNNATRNYCPICASKLQVNIERSGYFENSSSLRRITGGMQRTEN